MTKIGQLSNSWSNMDPCFVVHWNLKQGESLTSFTAWQQRKTALWWNESEWLLHWNCDTVISLSSYIYTWQHVLQQAQYFQQQSSRSASSNKRNNRSGSNHRRLAAGQSEGLWSYHKHCWSLKIMRITHFCLDSQFDGKNYIYIYTHTLVIYLCVQ